MTRGALPRDGIGIVPDLLRLDALSEAQRAAVQALAARTRAGDGVAPLSEQFLLDLTPGSGAEHLLGYAGAHLVGYAQVGRHPGDGQPRGGELAVDPAYRRRGVGTALIAGISPPARLWAHGDLPPARAFAAARRLGSVRELHLMALSLTDVPTDPVAVPTGFEVRAFRPGADDLDWLAVNAAAFATHPEQGRLTLADLRERIAQPWFDPAGLLLLVPRDPVDGAPLAGFHWTKIEVPEAGTATADEPGERTGEVYVVAVHPAYQGRGLGPVVTRLGLDHLRERGCDEALLYVDGDNPAALATYRSLGFATRHVDRMLALPLRSPKVGR